MRKKTLELPNECYFFIFKSFLCKFYVNCMKCLSVHEKNGCLQRNIISTKTLILNPCCFQFLTTQNYWILLLYTLFHINEIICKIHRLTIFGYSEVSIISNLIFLLVIQQPSCTTSWRCSRVKFDLVVHSEDLLQTILDMFWKHFECLSWAIDDIPQWSLAMYMSFNQVQFH